MWLDLWEYTTSPPLISAYVDLSFTILKGLTETEVRNEDGDGRRRDEQDCCQHQDEHQQVERETS